MYFCEKINASVWCLALKRATLSLAWATSTLSAVQGVELGFWREEEKMIQHLFLLIELLVELLNRKKQPINKKTSLADKIEITININKG